MSCQGGWVNLFVNKQKIKYKKFSLNLSALFENINLCSKKYF